MSVSPRAAGALCLYAAAYAVSLAVLFTDPGFQRGEALAAMLVFGVAFSAIAWLVTAGGAPAAVALRRPAAEFWGACAYLCLFAVVFLGWGLSALRAAFASERAQAVAVLAAKLAVMVVLPGWLLTRLGYTWSELLGPRPLGRSGRRALVVMGMLLLALQLIAGRGPQSIAALSRPAIVIGALAPVALAVLVLEAGLTEEFLFRALFQARAAAWLRSETAGMVAMALAFALAHAPGYVLRGAHAMEGMTQAPTALTAAAYAVAVVSPLGLTFGVLWARTRNLWLLAALHGWADLVPNLAPFVRTWAG